MLSHLPMNAGVDMAGKLIPFFNKTETQNITADIGEARQGFEKITMRAWD